jgi:glycosyltransferase involved in cell wall biosynthesis
MKFVRDNRDIPAQSGLALAANAIWSGQSRQELKAAINRCRPDVIHAHNTMPLISPSAYYAAGSSSVPIVKTLHNFRPLCLPGVFFRDGKVCEDCLTKSVCWPGIKHACYRGSGKASAAVATTFAIHRTLGTWSRKIDRYIALTNFAREKFIEGGLPPDRVVVKPNFTFDRGIAGDATDSHARQGALFVGRLSREKGVLTMISAWKDGPLPLTVIGDGPLLNQLESNAPTSVTFAGEKLPAEVSAAMNEAMFLVMPSEWYEGFALVLVEAFSRGLPVIASRLGAMAEIVEDGITGLHFRARDAADLAEKATWAAGHPVEMRQMGRNARETYLKKYTPEMNYKKLISIYEDVIDSHQASGVRANQFHDEGKRPPAKLNP